MRPIVIDREAWYVRLFVGLSVTLVSPAKTTEAIEMQFGLRTQVGLGGPKEAHVQSYSSGGANVHDDTLP